MSGTLYVVATPIGNLEDITLRALRVLREVALIAAEDTRRTAKLLAHFQIKTPMISFHEHNAQERIPGLLARLSAGAAIALVSDAGTPGVSDPGVELIRACRQGTIPIEPVPGACAALTAAVVSGFPLDPLRILGFVPSRSNDRIVWLERLKAERSAVVFFESPHRIRRTLTEAGRILGTRQIFIGREMTKLNAEFLLGDAASVLATLSSFRGEFTLVLGPMEEPTVAHDTASDADIAGELARLPVTAVGRRASIARLAKKYGRSTNELYSLAEQARGTRR